MLVIHWTDNKDFQLRPIQIRNGYRGDGLPGKPLGGLWTSPYKSKNSWKQWCKDNNQIIKTYIMFNNSLFKTIHIETRRQRYNGSKNAIAVWVGVRFKTVSDVLGVSGSPTRKTNVPRKKEGLDLFSDKEASTHPAHLTQNSGEDSEASFQ